MYVPLVVHTGLKSQGMNMQFIRSIFRARCLTKTFGGRIRSRTSMGIIGFRIHEATRNAAVNIAVCDIATSLAHLTS